MMFCVTRREELEEQLTRAVERSEYIRITRELAEPDSADGRNGVK